MISTRNSRTTGRRAKDDAPSMAATTYEGMMVDALDEKMSPMYAAAITGMRILIVRR